MTTTRVWVLAAAALVGTACSSDSSPAIETDPATGSTSESATGTTSATSAGGKPAVSSTTTGATPGTGGRAATMAPNAATPVATGNTATMAAAGRTSATAAGTGAAATTNMQGSAGMTGQPTMSDDSDAGVADGTAMTAANGGSVARAGAGAAAGSHAAGSGGMSGAGKAGAGGAGGKVSEQPAMPQVPADTSMAGPWPVGVRTVSLQLGANVTPVEVWYPAKPGSESERKPVSYDLTAWLPPEHGIPANAAKVHIDCNCYRELPPDTAHGPFPVVVVVHDRTSFRAAFASQMTHWASRGFVAIAADHPGLLLRDALAGNGCSGSGVAQDIAHTRDVPALLRALGQADGIFSFLKGVLDPQKIALGGHGDGAAYAADNADQPGVKAIFSFSGDTVVAREGMLAGAFFLSGMSDKIVPYNDVVRAYENTARGLRPSLLAGMANVGHLGFTDMCSARNSDGQDAIAMARRYNICGGAAINVADQYLWDCPLSPLAGADNYLDAAATSALVRKLSTLALEELLLGKQHSQDWNTLAADTAWGELRQTR